MWLDVRAKLAEIEGRPPATSATTATQAPTARPMSQVSQVSQPPGTQKPATLKATWAEVGRLPLLDDDREFIRERISGRPDAAALLARYLIVWRAAADGEPVSFRKSNRGRYAANIWLRRATEGGIP